MSEQGNPEQAPAGSADGLGAVAGSIMQQQLLHAQKILDQQHDLITKYVGEKIKAENIRNYNGANLAYNHARDTAAKLGLDDNGINPYPGKNTAVVVSNQESPAPSPPEKKKGLPTWVSLLLGAGLGGGALVIPSILSRFASEEPQQQTPQTTTEEPQPRREYNDPYRHGDVGFTVE